MAFLTGHSGAGKSTLLKLIMLMERASRGEVLFEDKSLTRMKKRFIPYHRRRIGVVFQNHSLLFDRNVYDNVALPLLVSGYSAGEIARRVRAALDKVGLLQSERMNPEVLSGGEQQRVGIARALVHKPDLVLADEPTGNLDPKLSWEIMQLFQQFNSVGVTVLIATHDIALISQMGKREIQLSEGCLVADTGSGKAT
jgi:cell division transport system ATP-binding protein